MIPAGLENSFNESDFDEDEGFEFEFNETNKNIQKAELVNYSTNNFLEQTKEYSEVNNNCYYDDQTDLILDDLKRAVIQNKLELVKNLIETNDLDVNICFKNDWTPLMYAASNGSIELVEYLVQKGADTFYSDDSFSVIHCAAGCSDMNAKESDLVKIIELLISKGVDPNTADKYYQTPLMYAARVGNLSLIECLAKLNADLDAQDDKCWTALSHASNKGYLKCVQALLKLNADPTIYTNEFFYPFDLAEKAGYTEIASLIKRYIRVKKIENKDADEIENVFQDYETSSDSKSCDSDDQMLEQFLKSIHLKSLFNLFKAKQVKLKDLFLYTDDDLLGLGINDRINRHIILNEIKKFHLKNWKSSSLIPVRQDSILDCNEVSSIISNLSRHADFMSCNVKYLLANANRIEAKENTLFIDKYLNSKLVNGLKQALANTYQLYDELQRFSVYVAQNVDIKDLDKKPIDLIEANMKKSSKSKQYFKIILCTSGVLLSAFTILKIIAKK